MDPQEPLFIIVVTAGAVMFITGLVLMFFPPKNINHIYGYRSKKSMESEENWVFAQRYSAKLLVALGAAFVLLGFVCSWFSLSETISAIIAVVLVIISALFLIVKTESELKKKNENEQDLDL